MPDPKSKVARMVQPESLKSEKYQPWSRGGGVEVWAMICAAITGDLDTIKRLVNRDPNLIDCEYEYFKPIRFAVRENQRSVVDFLLERGADPAYEAGESLLRRLILRYQPDILKRSPDPTAWWSLATPPSPEVARWAMEHGLDPNRRNWLGITMLHRCAAKGESETGQVCLDYRANIDALETEWSSTPLGWAAREGKKEMVQWLLKKGANPNLPDGERWALPIEWAKRRGHHEIIELLKNSGAE